MSTIRDYEDADKAMSEVLRRMGIEEPTPYKPTPEERVEWECEGREYAREGRLQVMEYEVYSVRARTCPVCGAVLGSPDFEPEDRSVGIIGSYWYNVCPYHGEITVWDDGTTEVGNMKVRA